MSFAKKYNKERLFEVDNEGLEYASGEGLLNKYGKNAIYEVSALYISKAGLYGDSPIARVTVSSYSLGAGDNDYTCLLNMPKHMTDVVKEILSDPASINDIRSRKVGIKLYNYHSDNYNKDCVGVEWVDL